MRNADATGALGVVAGSAAGPAVLWALTVGFAASSTSARSTGGCAGWCGWSGRSGS